MYVKCGVLYKGGIPLYNEKDPVRVSISLPCLGPKPLQGLLLKVWASKHGRIFLRILERNVDPQGYYVNACSDKQPLVISTYSISAEFLQLGWTEEQGSTKGYIKPKP